MTPPEYLQPRVYIEEAAAGVHTISGVETSVTAFIGAAQRGPVNKAVRITSFAEFERKFGGLVSSLELGYAISQFFLNGGMDAWVVRIARNVTAARVRKALAALDTVDSINILALPGFTRSKIV